MLPLWQRLDRLARSPRWHRAGPNERTVLAMILVTTQTATDLTAPARELSLDRDDPKPLLETPTMTITDIHPAYLGALETEGWALLSMSPETGLWEVEVAYDTSEATLGECPDQVHVSATADAHVADEVAHGRWEAHALLGAFEVAVLVPRHVAEAMVRMRPQG